MRCRPPGQRGPTEHHEPESSHRQRDRSQLPATGRVRRGPGDSHDLDEMGLGARRQSPRRISAASRDQACPAETASATVRSEAALGRPPSYSLPVSNTEMSSSAEDLPPDIADMVMAGGRLLLMHTETTNCLLHAVAPDRLLPPEPPTTRV